MVLPRSIVLKFLQPTMHQQPPSAFTTKYQGQRCSLLAPKVLYLQYLQCYDMGCQKVFRGQHIEKPLVRLSSVPIFTACLHFYTAVFEHSSQGDFFTQLLRQSEAQATAMDARGRRREIVYVHEEFYLPAISLEGRWFKGLRLKRQKRELVIKLQEVYIAHKSHCARLAYLVAEVQIVAKRMARLGAAIAAKGPGILHTKGIHGHTQLTAEQYAPLCQAAIEQFATAITEDLQYFTVLSEPVPKPELVVIKQGSFGSIRPDSLMLKPSQLDQDLHAQVVRMTKGKQSLFPICYEVFLLQEQAITLLDIIDEQAAAIDRLYCRLTVRGVYRGLVARKHSFPERLFTELSLKINNHVDWLLAPAKHFDDVSPSDCVVSEESEQEQQQQQPAVVQDCTVEIKVPSSSSKKKDKGKPNLGKRLLGGFASNLGKLGKHAAKAAGRVLRITKPAT